jgi:hypothetical protein
MVGLQYLKLEEMIPGDHLAVIERSLATIIHANDELQNFHRARATAIIQVRAYE